MKPFKKYASALRDEVREWAKSIGDLDILVGVPSFNNEDTIRHVVETVGKGLVQHFPDANTAIFVSDGGSLDDTREQAEAAQIPEKVHRKVAIYRGMPGKGTSFRAVFELARLCKADACVVFDADLRSITPDWVRRMAEPVVQRKADFVAPFYVRHKFDGTITNHIVYPTTRALYGKDVRQPIGGDFAFNGALAAFYADQDVWLTDVAQFGIDIWMTTCAINEGFKIVQSNLGVKIHDPKDPSEDLGPMFRQVISTMFFLMGQYEQNWKSVQAVEPVPVLYELDKQVKIPPVSVTLHKLKQEFLDGFEHFDPMYQQVLDASNYQGLKSCYRKLKKTGELDLPPDLWSRVIYDFAFTYQSWSRNRRRLVDIMTPLYFGRVGAYCTEVVDLDDDQAEEVIQEQAKIFERNREYLIKLFQIWE
ncbi:MAG TPA: glycosyltransferase [Bacteroidetes bacterium]|nr:glycosyltransferase [Bacteroidota bacterium]